MGKEIDFIQYSLVIYRFFFSTLKRLSKSWYTCKNKLQEY